MSATPASRSDASIGAKAWVRPRPRLRPRARRAAVVGRAVGRAAGRRAVRGHGRARDQGGDGPAHRPDQRQPLRRGAHAAGAARDTSAAACCGRAMDGSTGSRLSTSEQVALRYAEILTRNVNWRRATSSASPRTFNDSEIVELTMTVSFFNFFTRYAEALSLPVEPWALDGTMRGRRGRSRRPPSPASPCCPTTRSRRRPPRSPGASDPAAQQARRPRPRHGQLAARDAARARHPAGVARVRQQRRARRQTVGRDIKLQVSFAVSMANGCRYCTLHQVLGLRRLGVDPASSWR